MSEFWKDHPRQTEEVEPASRTFDDVGHLTNFPESVKSLTQVEIKPPYTWCEINFENKSDIDDLESLLSECYLSDGRDDFHLVYPSSIIKWIISHPGSSDRLNVGLRMTVNQSYDSTNQFTISDGKLVSGVYSKLLGFICGIPRTMVLGKRKKLSLTESTLLCLDKRLRKKGFVKLLLLEFIRKQYSQGLRTSLYFNSDKLSDLSSFFKINTWIRNINFKKLYTNGFCGLAPHLTKYPIGSSEVYYSLPSPSKRVSMLPEKINPGQYRTVTLSDSNSIALLFNSVCKDLNVRYEINDKEAQHMFGHKADFYCFVLGSNDKYPHTDFTKTRFEHEMEEYKIHRHPEGIRIKEEEPLVEPVNSITDLISFYMIKARLNNGNEIKQAFGYYILNTTISNEEAISDLMVLCGQYGADTVICQEQGPVYRRQSFERLKFDRGTGNSYAYLYNFKMPLTVKVDDMYCLTV